MRYYLLLLILLPISALAEVAPYTWQDLTQFDRLPELEGPPIQQSSGWDHLDATGHGAPGVRTPSGAYLLLEAKGPGCLTGIYAGPPEKGHLRFYFDGEVSPRIDIEWPELLRQLRGQSPIPANSVFQPPFMFAGNWHVTGTLCLPFAKSLTITSDTPLYQQRYHFTYCRYPVSVPITSYTPTETISTDKAFALYKLEVTEPGLPPPLSGCRRTESQLEFSGSGSITIAQLSGTGVIRRMWIELTPADPTLLRRLLFQARWDSETKLAASIPLADLCGAPWSDRAPRALSQLRLQQNSDLVRQESCIIRYPMPFTNGATVSLVYTGTGHAGPLRCVVDYAPLESLPTSWGRLHAGFQRGKWEKDDSLDLLNLPGPGRLVGLSMTAWPWRTGTWDNDVETHWQMTMDGNQALVGDGWLLGWEAALGVFSGSSELPLFRKGTAASFSRQYILDSPIFSRSLAIRLLPRKPRTHFSDFTLGWVWYSGVTASPTVPTIDPENLIWPQAEFGFIEGEDLLETAQTEHSRLRIVEDPENRFFLSRGKMLVFSPDNGRAVLDLWVPVDKSGRYRLDIRHFQGIEFDGIWHVQVNEVRCTNGMRFLGRYPRTYTPDSYGPAARLAVTHNWGTFDFTAPFTRLTFTFDPIIGPPTAAESLGIDDIRLVPVKPVTGDK